MTRTWLIGLRVTACAALFAGALGLRSRGLDWPNLHPDSQKIDRWIRWTLHHAYVRDQVYPGGFFTMLRPVHRVVVARRAALDPALPRKAVEAGVDVIRLGRTFNAWLGAATALLVLGLAWSVTGSFAAGLLAGLLVAFHPFHIEHCHYAETDIAMVFTLALGLLLWSRVRGRAGVAWFLLASVASGFAAGTKYTLVLLLPLVFFFAVQGAGARVATWRRVVLLSLLGVAGFMAGFAWANPAVLNPGWFFPGLRQAAAGVLEETSGVIGEASGRPFARMAHQLRWLGRFLWAYGPVVLAVGAAGVVALATRFRRDWRVVFVLPVLYGLYLVGRAPWIRMQETLVFLPFLACACAAACAWLAGRPAGTPRGAAAAAALGLVLCAATLPHGLRRASLFTPRDTRHFAQDWLQRHLPRGRVVGLEIYTKARLGYPVPVRETRPLYKLEREGLEAVSELGCDYVLRNASMPGRGSFDPFTGRRYERLQRNLDAFRDGARRLAVWSPAPATDEVTFAFVNSTLELYALRPAPPPRVEWSVPLVSPLVFEPDRDAVCFPAGAGLGADAGLEVTTERRRFLVGGPDLPRVVQVLLYSESGMVVRVDGYGVRRRVELAPGIGASVRLRRPWWRPRLSVFETIELTPGRRQPEGARCLGRLCFDEDAAAAALAEWGGEEAVLPPGAEPGRALALPEEGLAVNGVLARDYNEMARVYLSDRDGELVVPIPGPAGPGRETRTGEVEFPVWLPRGTWHFRAQVRLSSLDPGLKEAVALRVRDGQGQALGTLEWAAANVAEWQDLNLELVVSRARPLWLGFEGPAGVCVRLRNPELHWTLADRLRSRGPSFIPPQT